MFPAVGRAGHARSAGFRAHDAANWSRSRWRRMAAPCSRSAAATANGRWCRIRSYARRITAETPMDITGPAAGHDRMKTYADPTGPRVLGMINNCAGGMTPWGTWLTCEENFNGYFWGKLPTAIPRRRTTSATASPGNAYRLGQVHDRFDVCEGAERGQPLRLDRRDRPVRPALDAEEAHRARPLQARGRGRHRQPRTAGTWSIQGDDERFDYVYKFVTAGARRPREPRRQPRPARRRHALRRPVRRRRHAAPGCRWSSARAR